MSRTPKEERVEIAPCDDCLQRPNCAREFIACDAYEKFVDGKPMRVWRDADRTPSRFIAKELLVKWHGKEKTEGLLP